METRMITIGRQFGSGGREVGKEVAKLLGIDYYDKELITVAAKASGLNAQFLENYDEKRTNSLLYSLVMGHAGMILAGQGATSVEVLAQKAQREAVLNVAKKGSCVIVGRCADYILRDRPGLVRVFISANLQDRIAHVSKREEISPTKAEERIRRMDKARNSYYSFNTDQQWGAAENYDLCINVSRCGIKGAAEMIVDFAAKLK